MPKLEINKENYLSVKPYLPEDKMITDLFKEMEIILNSPDLNKKGNEEAQESVVMFFDLLNGWVDSGLIKMPEQKEEPNLLQKKTTLQSHRTIRPDYISRIMPDQKKPVIKANNNELTHQFLNKIDDVVNSIEEQQKKKDELIPTIRPDYTLNENDKKFIKEFNLPESKKYIYKEVRNHFGNSVDMAAITNFGLNKFCKKLTNLYPEGFKRTEMQSIINQIIMYDSLKIEK
jgi:hypothetical protein